MSQIEYLRFNIPGGRIVQGSPTYKQTKNYRTGEPLEKPRWFLAVAVPKGTPAQDPHTGDYPQGYTVENQICAIGSFAYHQNVQAKAVQDKIVAHRREGMSPYEEAAAYVASEFKFKIVDGDHPENAKKEGFAGCWIYKYQTTLGVPTCVEWDGRGNQQIDPERIKTGHYVDVYTSVGSNGLRDQNAGVYMNPNFVRLLGYGQEIVTGPNPDDVMGAAPAQLPPGASPTPVAGGAMPGQQQYAPPPAGQPGQQQYAPPPAGQPGQQQYAPPPAGQPGQQQYGQPGQQQYAPPPAGQPGQQQYAPPPAGQPGQQQYAPQQQQPGQYAPPPGGQQYDPGNDPFAAARSQGVPDQTSQGYAGSPGSGSAGSGTVYPTNGAPPYNQILNHGGGQQ